MPENASRGGPQLDRVLADLRRLRRSRTDRVAGGVCGGIGHDLGVDPVLLRVVVGVLALFGGSGVILYAAGWLLIPEDGGDQSIAERQIGQHLHGSRLHGDHRSPAAIAVVVGIGLVLTSIVSWGPPWHALILVVLTIAGVAALARRSAEAEERNGGPEDAGQGYGRPHGPQGPDGAPGSGHSGPGGSPPEDSGPGDSGPGDSGWTGGRDGPGEPAPFPSRADHGRSDREPAIGGERADPSTPAEPAHEPVPAGISGGPEPGFWDRPDPLGLDSDVRVVPLAQDGRPRDRRGTERAPRRRSMLFPITLGATLVVLGTLSALAGSAFPVAPGGYLAAALGAVGVGLIAGTWYGRSGGLVALGILLSFALFGATALAQVDWDTVNEGLPRQAFHPHSVGAIQDSYRFGAASAVLDLSDVPFADATRGDGREAGQGGTRDRVGTHVQLGTGKLVVTVPPKTDVEVDGQVGFGEANIFGHLYDGPVGRRHVVDLGRDGAGGGHLTLDLRVGAGEVVIRRE